MIFYHAMLMGKQHAESFYLRSIRADIRALQINID